MVIQVLAKPHIALMAIHYTIRARNWDYLSVKLKKSQGVRQGIQGYWFPLSMFVDNYHSKLFSEHINSCEPLIIWD